MKGHNTFHDSCVVTTSGPLYYTSTFRYEKKHSFFKWWAKHISQEGNLLLWLAELHQNWWSSEWEHFKDFDTLELSKELPLIGEPPHESTIPFREIKYFTFRYLLKIGNYVTQEYHNGQFYKIKKIAVLHQDQRKDIYLLCQPVETVFKCLYNSYEIISLDFTPEWIHLSCFKNLENYSAMKSNATGKEYICCMKNCLTIMWFLSAINNK